MLKLAVPSSLLLLLLAATAAAQPIPELSQAVRVTAQGGATLKAPAWKSVRSDEAVAVLEQAPDPTQKRPFYVLMVAIEEGPSAGVAVPWDKIKENVVTAATRTGRSLSLELGDVWAGAPGFEGRYMSGSFRGSDEQQVGLELLALVKDGKLLTVSLVSQEVTADTRALLQAVAATAALGG